MSVPPGGLVEATMPTAGGLARICPRLREQVAAYLQSVYAPDCGSPPFHENPSSRHITNLETTVWALVCLEQIGARDRIAEVRDRALAHIDRFYNPASRTYQDDNAQAHHCFGAWHMHNDVVARIGLGILGARPRGNGDSLDYLKHHPWAPQPGSDIDAWLHRCWEKDPRAALKEIYQYLVLYCTLRCIRSGVEFDGHVRHIVGFLESKRDCATGFIGMAPGKDLGWVMRGYRNFVINFYWPMGVVEVMLDRLIDSTLACQRPDGLFHDGGMCSNMDALQLLAEYALRTGERTDVVIDSCRRCIRAMFAKLMLPCGGFRFNADDCPTPERDGYGKAAVTNGTAFAMYTLRYWQAIDPQARQSLATALDDYWPAGMVRARLPSRATR